MINGRNEIFAPTLTSNIIVFVENLDQNNFESAASLATPLPELL